MDEKLSKALEFGNYSTTLANQKRMLHEKFTTNSVYFVFGGQFTITRELITYCEVLINHDQTSSVLIDDNDVPIKISDLEDFLSNILDKYFTALNEYHAEYEKLSSHRSVSGLVE